MTKAKPKAPKRVKNKPRNPLGENPSEREVKDFIVTAIIARAEPGPTAGASA